MSDKYYVKAEWEDEYNEVDMETYMRAEKSAGFWPKFPGRPATGAFSGRGISGHIIYDKTEQNPTQQEVG